MQDIIIFLLGLAIGSGVVAAFYRIQNKSKDTQVDSLKSIFNELSQSALDNQSERFLQLAETKLDAKTKEGEKDLEGKKKLIDNSLDNLKGDLGKVEKLIQTMETQRSQAFGSLTSQLKTATEQTVSLQQVTTDLKSVLSNNQVRGQWGERMAEDILTMAGFLEGVNYEKQKQLEDGKSKPDFTFNMPDGHVLNMDVKFPLNSYERYLETDIESDKEKHKKQFLKDVNERIKEIQDRGYINSGTLDYVLLFIPNEQIYSFINEHDRDLLDKALGKKVVICGPNTLYAILAVVNQASKHYKLEKTSSEIIKVLMDFKKQWGSYTDEFSKLESQFSTLDKTFERLKTTRTRQLEKQLDKVEELSNSNEDIKTIEEKTI